MPVWSAEEIKLLEKTTKLDNNEKAKNEWKHVITRKEIRLLSKWSDLDIIAFIESRVVVPKLIKTEIKHPDRAVRTSDIPKTVICYKIVATIDQLVDWLKRVAKLLAYTDRTEIRASFFFV